MKVVQTGPGARPGGPARDEMLLLHRLFLSWGWESELLPDEPVETESKSEGESSSSAAIDPDALLICHFHLTSPPVEISDHSTERTIVVLHELLPTSCLERLDYETRGRLEAAHDRLAQLATGCELAIGHSTSACDRLERIGFQRVRRLPPLVDFEALDAPADPLTLAMLDDNALVLLYAGDLHAASGTEDLIKTAWYHRSFLTDPTSVEQFIQTGELGVPHPASVPPPGGENVKSASVDSNASLGPGPRPGRTDIPVRPQAGRTDIPVCSQDGRTDIPVCPPFQLVLTGGADICPGYYASLSDLVAELEMGDDAVLFAGELDPDQLRACLRRACVYIHLNGADLSGARILQAIHCGVPVVAIAEGAAPEILGDAGILLDSAIHSAVAETLHRIIVDADWRQLVIRRQRRRLEEFSSERTAFLLRSLLSRFIG